MEPAPAAPTPPPELRRARGAVAAVFFALGAIVGNLFPRIPDLKQSLGLGEADLGFALLGFSIGSVAALVVAVRLVARFGSRPVVRAATALLAASLLAPALARGVASLGAGLALLGAANGLLDVAMNAHGVRVERAFRRPLLSSFHALFSVGFAAGGALGGVAAAIGLGPGLHFALAGAGIGLPVWIATGALLPAAADRAVAESAARSSDAAGLGSPSVLPLGAIAFCSFLGEGSAADWSAVYLREHAGAGPGAAAAGFVAFSLAMAGLRFVGDPLTARFGRVAVLRASGLVAAAGLAFGLALAGPVGGALGFGLFGAGLALVVPVAFSAAGSVAEAGEAGRRIARVAALGYAGSFVGPPAIGLAAEWLGLRAALGIPAALAAVIVFAAPAARPRDPVENPGGS